ncbi:BatD family protein [Candidatus Dependentiae bacterium]|nr:BatD family protein [Candidatus Dependentiae bacterium]
MDKKIGNLFLIVFLFSTVLCGAKRPRIDIELMNKNHQIITGAQIGVPFVIQVICKDFDPKSSLQGIASTSDVALQFAGTTQLVKQVNGSMMQEDYIFKYVGLTKKKGIIELGPITAQDANGNTVHSEKVSIQVGDIVEKQHTGNEQYLLDVVCQPEEVYVGQKLKILVNFCHQLRFDDLAIENTSFDDVVIGHQDKNWRSVKQVIGSTEYPCKQMCIEVYPKTVGTLIIPSFQATFIAEQDSNMGIFGFFGFVNSKILESHSKQIEVLSLPVSDTYKNVEAVGRFDTVTFTIDPQKGEIGEGIHAKMVVQGDGNLEIVRHPELVLAQGIHFYEGNSSLKRLDDTTSIKTFDWVLQADYPGTFIIAEQKFVYFDPVDKKYKELCTTPVQLDIVSKNNLREDVAEEETISDDTVKTEEKNDPLLDQKKELVPQEKKIYYSSNKFYQNKASFVLTWWIIFWGIVASVLFLMILILPYLKKIFFIETLQYRWLFWKYSKSENIQDVYKLFEKISHDYGFGLQSEELNQAFLKNNLSNESFENWKNFLNMLLEFNFASNQFLQDKRLVLDLAKEWFSIILLCCKTLRSK